MRIFERARFPSRRWLVISPGLIAAAVFAPEPGPPADPAAGLFSPPVLVAHAPRHAAELPPDALLKDPGLANSALLGDRVVPYGSHEGIGPVYSVTLMSIRSSTAWRRLGLNGSATPDLGFFHRSDAWRYELKAMRFDRGARDEPAGSLWLPDDEARAMGPLAVAELDRRSGGRLGTELERLLDEGASRDSWVNWQNAVVLAAWLSVPVAFWAWLRGRAAAVGGLAKKEAEPLA